MNRHAISKMGLSSPIFQEEFSQILPIRLIFQRALTTLTVGSGFQRENLVGVGYDEDSGDVFGQDIDGRTLDDLSYTDLRQGATLGDSTELYTIPAGFNRSNVKAFVIDSGASQSALYFDNCSFVVAASETDAFAFATARVYNLTPPYSCGDVEGVVHHNFLNQFAAVLRVKRPSGCNVVLVDNSQANLGSDINFTDFGTEWCFPENANVSMEANVSFTANFGNSTDALTTIRNGIVTEISTTINDVVARYVNWTGILQTNDRFVTPTIDNVSITYNIPVAGGGTCDCPASGNWEICDGSICNLTSSCDIGTNKLRVCSGSGLLIQAGGSIYARGGCFIGNNARFHNPLRPMFCSS